MIFKYNFLLINEYIHIYIYLYIKKISNYNKVPEKTQSWIFVLIHALTWSNGHCTRYRNLSRPYPTISQSWPLNPSSMDPDEPFPSLETKHSPQLPLPHLFPQFPKISSLFSRLFFFSQIDVNADGIEAVIHFSFMVSSSNFCFPFFCGFFFG